MEVAVVSPGAGSADLPSAPPPADGYGWGAMVPKPPPAPRRSTGHVAFLGVVALVAFVCAIAISSAYPEQPGSWGPFLMPTLFALWVVSGFFWIWMLVDAVSNSKFGWAIAIFVFGLVAALPYALLARPRSTVRP